MSDIRTQLEQLQEQINQKSIYRTRLNHLYPRLSELEEKEKAFYRQRYNEQSDVDKLEKASLSSFFYMLIGKKDDILQKEKQEAYEAALRYDMTKQELDAVKNEIRKYEYEIKKISDYEKQYQRLIDEQAQFLADQPLEVSKKIKSIQEEIHHLHRQLKEIDEAYAVGKRALQNAVTAQSQISSAEGWGVFDVIGGGLLSDVMKHSHLDDAQSSVSMLNIELQKYRTELMDIQVESLNDVSIEGFGRFADYFFDGIFADYSALSRIHNSQKQIENTISKIKETQIKLERMQSEVSLKISQLKTQLDTYILQVL